MYSVMLLSAGRDPDSRPDEDIRPLESPLVPDPRVPDPREAVESEPAPRVKFVGEERLPREEDWRLLWVWRGEDCWRRDEQEELAALNERDLGAALDRGLNPPLREWALLKWGLVVTGAISLVSGGRVPMAVFRS